MEMTYNQYIQNPMGIRNSVISNREMYREMYTKKWGEIKLRENGNIKYIIMRSKSDYYVYIKIPSEVVPKFYYDIVVRFYPPKDKKAVEMERTIENYNVQFYSNDPSFVFTFAHSFKKNGLIFQDMNPRMSKLALKQNADVRNPTNQVGYVKSLYFAYLEIKNKGLLQKISYTAAIPYDKNYLLSVIEDADIKIDKRQEEGKNLEKKKKRKNANDNKDTEENKTPTSPHVITPKNKISGKSKISAKSKISGKSKITGRKS